MTGRLETFILFGTTTEKDALWGEYATFFRGRTMVASSAFKYGSARYASGSLRILFNDQVSVAYPFTRGSLKYVDGPRTWEYVPIDKLTDVQAMRVLDVPTMDQHVKDAVLCRFPQFCK